MKDSKLIGFRKAQDLAYRCTDEVSKHLKLGITEIEVANLLDDWLRDHHIHSQFHRPFAWFGGRTKFEGMKKYKDFLPSSATLSDGDVVILDVAPILEGYIGDVGYTFQHGGPSQELVEAMNTLMNIRKKIPRWVNEKSNASAVWKEVDSSLKNSGYENCYERYPFSVLGHRVTRSKLLLPKFLSSFEIPFSYLRWFRLPAISLLMSKGGLKNALLRESSKYELSGLWAIEPHLGSATFGAKFEEILYIDENGSAEWLSDNVPHAQGLMFQ